MDGRKLGGDDGENSLEAGVAVLGAHVTHIRDDLTAIRADIRDIRDAARTDFRLLFGALIAVALGLAGLMARGFGWL